MDDSHVGSSDRQTHLRHLEAFFTALAVNGLTINLEKCVFATPSLEILFGVPNDHFWLWDTIHFKYLVPALWCYTFHFAKQQLIILSRTVQSKDSIAISRMRFTHAPPWRLGPRSYLLYSSASLHSKGKTLVFPRLRQFWAFQLSWPTNFCKEMNFLLCNC